MSEELKAQYTKCQCLFIAQCLINFRDLEEMEYCTRRGSENSIRSLYKLQCIRGDDWGIDGYHVAKKYVDAAKIKRDRQSPQKGHQRTLSKRVHKSEFLAQAIKQSVSPGPCAYNIQKAWADSKRKSQSKHPDRKTYIDDIFHKQKKEKYPAPNAYNVQQTQEQRKKRHAKLKQRKCAVTDRMSFLDTAQYDSEFTPGPGTYNVTTNQTQLHLSKASGVRIAKQTPKPKRDEQPSPDMFSYNPSIDGSFVFRQHNPKRFEEKKNGWGTEQRQCVKLIKAYNNKQNLSCRSKLPGPGQYEVLNEWAGKEKPSKKSLFKQISTGILKNIYY